MSSSELQEPPYVAMFEYKRLLQRDRTLIDTAVHEGALFSIKQYRHV